MKAAQLNGPRDVRLINLPDEAPGPGEILLNVTAVGVCGSDLHAYLHWQVGDTAPGGPYVLGHEASGVVAALGPGVSDSFYVGQRVAIDPAVPCLDCEFCRKGHPNLCTRLKFLGLWPYDGAMRTQMVHPARSCVPMPDGISDVGAALLEPLGVALHAIKLAKIEVGDDVLVTGCGAIGLLLIRLARLAGAKRIFASDKLAGRLACASTYGADVVINVNDTDVVSAVMQATSGRGVDVAIESAWVTETASQCTDAARLGGRVVIVGIPVEDFVSLRASGTRRKGLTIKFSRRMKHTYPAAIALAASGQVDVDSLASHRFPLAETVTALETAATYSDGVIRAMVMPNL